MRLENFKFISESNDSYQIAHPSGKHFTVNKSSLSDKASAAILFMKEKPQQFDEGGSPASDINVSPQYPDYRQAALNEIGPNAEPPSPVYGNPGGIGTTNVAPPPVEGPSGVQPTNPAAAAVANPEQSKLDKQVAAKNAHYAALLQQQSDLDNQSAQAIKDMGPEDRSRLWHNTSSGNKVLASLGIILSGFGAGAGQSNMAMDVLNKAIDQDIEAQRQDKSNAMNLWKMHHAALGDEMAATLQTKNNLIDLSKTQMEEMLGNLPGPLAQQKAQLASQVADKEKLQNAMQIANIKLLSTPEAPAAPAPAAPAPAKEAAASKQLEVKVLPSDEVDERKLSAARTLIGTVTGPTKELATQADKEHEQLQESNLTKQELKSDFDQMTNALKNNIVGTTGSQTKEWLGNLPWVGSTIGSIPPIGQGARTYEGAKGDAVNRINTLLTKRIGGEGAKNIKLDMPMPGDDLPTIQEKFERALKLIDSHTPTTGLRQIGALRKQK